MNGRFVLGCVPWNKGKHHSESTKRKLSLVQLGKKLTKEHKRNISLGNKGRICSEETKRKIGLANSIILKGRRLSDETKSKISISLKGRVLVPMTETTKNKISETKLAQKLHWSDEHKRRLSTASKKNWESTEYARKCTYIKGPNKAELKLLDLLNLLFPNEYTYVGDNKIRINSYNPDFINVNGQKKIIELFGERWHTNPQQTQDRIDTFTKYGYRTLIVWSKQLYKDTENLKNILLMFHKDKEGD